VSPRVGYGMKCHTSTVFRCPKEHHQYDSVFHYYLKKKKKKKKKEEDFEEEMLMKDLEIRERK
jgi:hypothetical protein